MTPRRRRMMLVGLIVLGVGAAAAFALTAFQDNLLYYYPPSDVAAGKAPADRVFRARRHGRGGQLQARDAAAWRCASCVTDFAKNVTVSYSGVLPDLFREGQGVIARGKLGSRRRVRRDEVLAKHDENYMPPEVAETPEEAAREKAPAATPSTCRSALSGSRSPWPQNSDISR